MPFDDTDLSIVTKTLLMARDRIERGWCQGQAHAPHGVCLLGALYDAPGEKARKMAVSRMMIAIKNTGFAAGSISEYNDVPGRTKEEILAIIDDAICGLD